MALTQASLNRIHQVSESCFQTALARSCLPMPFKANTFEGQAELVCSLIIVRAVHTLIKVSCLADKCIFPPKFRRLSGHFWQMTASPKPSMNNFPHKWFDTRHKSEKNALGTLKVSTVCFILGTDTSMQSECSGLMALFTSFWTMSGDMAKA